MSISGSVYVVGVVGASCRSGVAEREAARQVWLCPEQASAQGSLNTVFAWNRRTGSYTALETPHYQILVCNSGMAVAAVSGPPMLQPRTGRPRPLGEAAERYSAKRCMAEPHLCASKCARATLSHRWRLSTLENGNLEACMYKKNCCVLPVICTWLDDSFAVPSSPRKYILPTTAIHGCACTAPGGLCADKLDNA